MNEHAATLPRPAVRRLVAVDAPAAAQPAAVDESADLASDQVDDAASVAQTSDLPLLLDAAAAAQLLGLGRSTFLRFDAKGLVPRGVYIGSLRRWTRFELCAWVKAGCPPRDGRRT